MKYLYRLCIQWIFCALLIGWGTASPSHAQLPNADQQRYVGLQLLNLDRAPNAGLEIIEKSVGFGCNLVVITVFWERVYPTATSAPDWRQPDQQIALAIKSGAKVALRVMVGRSVGSLPGFWTSKESMHDDQGRPLQAIYELTAFSYAHEPTTQKAQKFIQEVCQRYNYVQNAGNMLYVSFVNIPGQESGNNYENWIDGDFKKIYVSSFDYSNAMTDGFQTWALQKYKRLAKINYVWKTRIASEKEIYAPTDWFSPRNLYRKTHGKDWYVYTHQVLKKYIDQTIAGIKSVNPSYKIVNDYGAVSDDISMLRTTLGFKDLDQNADGTKVNDDPYNFNHGWTIDVVRSNRPNKWVLNEVFTDEKYTKESITKQIDQNFAHGTRWINVLVGTIPSLNRIKDILQKTNEKWVKMPFVDVIPQRSMACSLAQLVEFGYFQGGIYAQWANQAGPESSRQPVALKINDDLLNDSLQGSVNRPPLLRNALPSKIIKVNAPFSYKLSSEVFVDIDGLIAKVEAIGLPSWLSFANNTFSGTPPRLGNFQFTVRATDDDGATIETTFSIAVDNNGRVNQKPVLKKKILDVAGLYKQALIFQIPDGTFADPDGFISRVEVTGLPTWASYRKGEIRGVADAVGTYPIVVKVYDDEEATAETVFNVVVTYPRVFFDLVQGGPPGKRVLLQRLQPVETLLAHNLPDLLNIYAACEVPFDTFDLQISGPYAKTVRVTRSPFALFEGSGGFAAVAGKYQLKGTAYFRQQLVASTVYTFSIVPTDPLTKQPRAVEDWAVYPNPFDEFLNVKLPAQFTKQNWQLELTNLSGQPLPLPSRFATLTDSLLSLNLSQSGLSGGLYLMKISNQAGDYKVFKIIKR